MFILFEGQHDDIVLFFFFVGDFDPFFLFYLGVKEKNETEDLEITLHFCYVKSQKCNV